MRLEAVVVCVDYSDFLAATLPINVRFFDRLVVISTPDDYRTEVVCDCVGVELIKTDVFNKEKGEFCKGKGINEGLSRLLMSDWVVHLDADIVLPGNTRRSLEKAELDPTCVYGIDRFSCRSYEDWCRYSAHPRPVLQHDTMVHPWLFPVGTRICRGQYGGYLPIGFLQLWNPKGSDVFSYPENHTRADRTDVLFSLNWPRRKRILLPEIIGIHLESEQAPSGANWSGRTTKKFGPNS